MKKIPILLLGGLILSLLSFEVSALCVVHGQIVRVDNPDPKVSPNKFIYLRGFTTSGDINSGKNNFVYYAITKSDSIASTAGAALTSGTRTAMSTDLATCPTGVVGKQFIGNVRLIIFNP